MSAYLLEPNDLEPSQGCVVVPTNRPEQIEKFVAAWGEGLWGLNVPLIIVHQSPSVPKKCSSLGGQGVYHYSWNDIDGMLGKDAWAICRNTDVTRNFGYLVAAKKFRSKFIITLDDDCLPIGAVTDFVNAHMNSLGRVHKWFSTTHDWREMKPRGMPSLARSDRYERVVLNHGLWNGVMDHGGQDQLDIEEKYGSVPETNWDHIEAEVIPRGFGFPMCGMNLSFRTEILPAMYFAPMGDIHRLGKVESAGHHRWGDIWCGIIAKWAIDAMPNFAVTTGNPKIFHERASNSESNAKHEKSGRGIHKDLMGLFSWKPSLERVTIEGYMEQAAWRMKKSYNEAAWSEYLSNIYAPALETWLKLCEEWEYPS